MTCATALLPAGPPPSSRLRRRRRGHAARRAAACPLLDRSWQAAAAPAARAPPPKAPPSTAAGAPVGGSRVTACVAVPADHAAWLAAAAWRYNDGASGAALNKTARNAVEYAAAVLSVDAVLDAAAAAVPRPSSADGAANTTDGATGGASPASAGNTDGGADVDAPAAAAAAAAAADPPAPLTVRLTAAPLRFLQAVAAADDRSGGVADALGAVLGAVRATAGGAAVFTCRWGGACDTASVYADVGVFARRGGGVPW